MQHYQWGILALALGAFGIGTTEFFPMGLLPTIAEGVHVSIPTAGMLISAYAVGVMIGAPVITLFLTRYGRKSVLIGLMGVFVVGNILSSLAINYETLLASRIITSMCHGSFFGIGALVAMNLAPAHKKGSAVASMFLGLTIANIIGVPLVTWLGQMISWRVSFAVTGILGVIAVLGLLKTLPEMPALERPHLKREVKAIIQPAALRAFFTTVLCAGSMFTMYTYITPILIQVASVDKSHIAYLLMLAGIGFTLGNYLSGKLADISSDMALMIFLTLQIIILFLFSMIANDTTTAAIAIFVWGVLIFGIGPPIQMKVMKIVADAPGLASSINIGAFNLGNAAGAALGGLVITLGFGYSWIPSAAALFSLGGLLMVLWARYMGDEKLGDKKVIHHEESSEVTM